MNYRWIIGWPVVYDRSDLQVINLQTTLDLFNGFLETLV